jgi:dihydrofolate reductase
VRKLVVTENVTLDGVIDGSTGWFVTWEERQDDDVSDVNDAQREHQADADAVLMGRVTFEEMRGYWPHQTNDETGVTKYLNEVSKYVVSSTMQDPQWERSTVLSGPVADDVRALKEASGADIVVTGSIRLVRELQTLGLVDEYRLFLYPVVLGEGRKLFEPTAPAADLLLEEVRGFRSGIVLLRYRSAVA